MKNRRNQLRNKIKEKNIEGLLVSSSSNVQYLTGFESEESYVFLTLDKCYFLTDFRYYDDARVKVEDLEVINYNKDGFIDTLRYLIGQMSIIGFEDGDLSVKAFKHLEIEFTGVSLIPSSGLVEDVRQIKDRGEIRHISKACEITDRVFAEILSRIKPGMTEKEIAAKIDYLLIASGGDERAFRTTVVGGVRTAFPHVKPSNYAVNEGDLLLVDFGASCQGYKSDMTRTLVMGKSTAIQREIYEIVRQAHVASLHAVKSGAIGKEVDVAAREIIDAAGFRKEFGHALGHGVGLDIHESPRLSLLSSDTLKANMVITVEPGIYLPGVGGFRIEDTLVITNRGYTQLTNSSRELIEIPV